VASPVAFALPTKFSPSRIELNPYIVNGTNANIVDYPWMVSFRVGSADAGSHNCGGSILTPFHILTACHCFGDNVQFGVSRITPGGPNVIEVQQMIEHEDYDFFTLENDIAILVLASEIPFGPTARAVRLPSPMYEASGNWETPANLVGFGYEMTGGSIQNDLQLADLHIASNQHCRDVHEFEVYDSMLCAGVPQGGKGQCSGDSGGPLTTVDGILLGIVSWSMKPCTIAPYPGVYTKVSHFCAWIESKVGRTLCGV